MKEKFFRGVVKHKRLVLIVFFIVAIFSVLCKQFVSVNYDINDYLPDDTASTVSINVMESEFKGGIPNGRIMVSNVTIPEAIDIKEKLESIDGVDEVTWLDDAANIKEPLETIDNDIIRDYYIDGNALFTVTIDESKRIEAVNEIRDLIGDDNAFSGTVVDTVVATESTTKEIARIVMIAVPFTLLVLLVTTTSWFEPIILLLSIGVAIMINSGTNLIFGEISFVTNAAGNILQLAVSLDYSVFLLHRYKEVRNEGVDNKEAMVQALCKSTGSILSSGLTTVIGFLALTVMQFKLGPDIGLALAKGIALSLITVFIFTPGLILYCSKIIDKGEHRSFMPSFDGFSKVVRKIMIPFTILFAVIIIPSYLASINNDYYYGASKIFGEDTKLGRDTKLIEDTFGKSNNFVLMVPRGDFDTEEKLSERLKEVEEVSSIISYVDKAGAEVPMEYLDEDTLSKLISDNYSRMVITVKSDYEGEEAFKLVEEIRSIAKEYYGDKYYLAGSTVSTYDLMDTVTADMVSVNLLAIGAVFVVLAVTMKSISVPIILVLAIETAIWFNLSIPYYMNTPLFYIAYLIISSVQLGATVDYAILMTERYLEFRKDFNKKESIVKTVSVSMVSILTSGTVLTAVGLLLGYMTSHQLLAQLGRLLGKGTICSLVIVIFVIPGLLYIFDSLVVKKNKIKKAERVDVKEGLI
ncbi:MMPL family transporter [Clostridium sp. NSJ-6]|uniref:MMPL family transporter n=1 Tax=Clostridium hominis TaxID=2763036 RepID=A0ABR7DCX2_9CLOT|nr:MMPL family transporter [Clostridium hominis]MBC5629245.1 MMPL family transporter [Clostridium hominis]MDU2671697.1 MMPL family transporter [Clostridium sp.]